MKKQKLNISLADNKSPLSVYNHAIQLMGMESVHDAIAEGGIDILRQDLPFVIVAAKWQKARKHRKMSNREVPAEITDDLLVDKTNWNPYENVERIEKFRLVIEALAELPDEDIIAVWDRFEGRSDAEIRKKWVKLKIGPKNPNISLIRKRRERALIKLKSILKERLSNDEI